VYFKAYRGRYREQKRMDAKPIKQAAFKHKRNSQYQVFTHENHALYLYSDKFIDQKLAYIHDNPVRAGIVKEPEDYFYSSAINYALEQPILLEVSIISTTWKTV